MHAWLHCIESDDEMAEGIRSEMGHLSPAVQLAQHCTEQVLKTEMVDKPSFADEFEKEQAQRLTTKKATRVELPWVS